MRSLFLATLLIFVSLSSSAQRDSILSSGTMYVMQKDMIGDTSILSYSKTNLTVKCFMINDVIDTIYSVNENGIKLNRLNNVGQTKFIELLPHLNIPDWELLSRVLKMYPDPVKRETELSKMAYTYRQLVISRFGNFNEDLALIKANDKFGYIDRKGRIKWELLFENAGGFENGVAHIQMNTIWYELDKDGLLK